MCGAPREIAKPRLTQVYSSGNLKGNAIRRWIRFHDRQLSDLSYHAERQIQFNVPRLQLLNIQCAEHLDNYLASGFSASSSTTD